jgi:hypothetical protein
LESCTLAWPDHLAGITAEGLAAVTVSLIQGCAVQAMNDPEHFDTDAYLVAARGIIGQLARAADLPPSGPRFKSSLP